MRVEATAELRAGACTMRIDRRARNLVTIAIEGHDTGEFGLLPMRCIEAFLPDDAPAILKIDARKARGATRDGSNAWATWLSRNRHRFLGVRMQVGSVYVRVTADFVRRFAGLEGLMEIESA